MALSRILRPGRGLNLPNSTGATAQNAGEEKGEELIKSTFDLLEKGEKEIKFDEKHKDVILILGNTGSGKSTFTQWVAGDNTKMISKETKEGTGEYIIEDHNRIGNSTLKSKTVFPELVIDPRTNAAYYDCPGFSDTQGTSHDIASTYFIKKVLDYSVSIKMVFVISHPSLRKGVDRQDFMKLVRHVTDLVKDIEKFKHSIAIVATKVDNQYIKQGTNFILVGNDKVISAIADFLQEAKQYLNDGSKRSNLSEKEKRFYENALKFVDALLEKDGQQYTKIGLFRRPDVPGRVSDIPLLQDGKKVAEEILYKKLKFAAKNNEDFGYTVSDKTKIDIIEIADEINKNIWSSLSKIAETIQENYRNLVAEIRRKIHLVTTENETADVSLSEAESFAHKFSDAGLITSEIISKTNNLTNPEELAVVINNTVSSLDINVQNDILYIAKQGNYFNFFQTVSDKTLNSRSWDKLLKDVENFLSGSKTIISQDINVAAEKINIRIQMNLNDTFKEIQKEYTDKLKLLEIQKLQEKLNRDGHVIFELTENIVNETTKNLVQTVRDISDSIGVSLQKEKFESISNQEKYIQFLEVIGNQALNLGPSTFLGPFKDIAKYFYDTGKWYTFLKDLYSKFSEYNIQKDRKNYNVADLEDWGLPGKPQGIVVTSSMLKKFLDKIRIYNVTEYDSIKNMTVTDIQMEDLNQVLSLTLKHSPTLRCSEPYILIKGSYISLNETMENIISNSDKDSNCKDFKTLLASEKYTLLKVFALDTVFIDTDLSFSGNRTSVAMISPKWEVVGSRSIDLRGADGRPNEKEYASNGDKPGESGKIGSPGKPGGSGESFFGIGTDFVNGINLTINSGGGMGSHGQHGGNGAPGLQGHGATLPDKNEKCENGHVGSYKCEEIKSMYFHRQTYTARGYRIFGSTGNRGGNGGNGGKGAKGGDPGTIEILEMNHTSTITKLTTKGKDGEDGKGGTSKGGLNGDDIIAKWNYNENWILPQIFGAAIWWTLEQTIKSVSRGPAGSNGTDGANSVGLDPPKQANGIPRLPNIINEYKNYLRENLNDRFENHYSNEFLDELNNKNDVRKLYDTLGLLGDFQGLENHFHKLSDQIDFEPFYLSLKEAISQFAKSHKKEEISGDYRKVLSYLYTATLSRIHSLKESNESNFIIDIRGYLALVKENINNLKDLQATINKVEVINKYKENYKKGIDKKTEEAKNFIKKQMNPEIENISKEIDDKVDALIEETIELQKQAEEEKKELEKKKEKLGNTLAIKGLFQSLQIIGGVVSFLGPGGKIASTVIEVTSTVSESLALNNEQQILNLPSDVVSGIKSVIDQIKMMKNQKVNNLIKTLDEISEEIKKNPEKLSDMTTKIEEIKQKLQSTSEKKLDFKQVKNLESELNQELKRKGEDLKTHLSDEKSKDALKILGKITQIAQFGSLLLNIYDKMKDDKEKMDVITDAIEKSEDKIKKLRVYEENIYETIIPMLQEMEDHMKDISDKLGSKSQVALDITKWKVQSCLKDVRLQMQRFTDGFNVNPDLSSCIDKLDEVMTTLINIYDRIQCFQDQQNLANYIADISSVSATSIDIKNQELVNSVNKLESIIRSNIVLKQYKAAMDAFKQWVFPYANHYIQKSMLPSQLQQDTNIQTLVESAMKEIETIKKKLDLYKRSIQNSDEFHQKGEFSSRYISSQPFFRWKNKEFGSLISKLLSGKQVVLKADIKYSVPCKDAIKFKVIDFYFKANNETSQSLLYQILRGFDIVATHLGNSYYRYADKYYLITSDSVPIYYSYEKNEAGEPIRFNDVYDKLKSGDILLSPYTLWEVRLINTSGKYSFKDLEKYKEDINLELSGFGSYVDMNVYRFATTAYKSFMVSNSTDISVLRSKATSDSQCSKPKYRLARSPKGFDGNGGYLTNGAPASMSSPINAIHNFLKTYIVSNAYISISQLFFGEPYSVNYSELSEINANAEKRDPTRRTSNHKATVTIKTHANSGENVLKNNGVVIESKSSASAHFDYHNNCTKPFLLSDSQKRLMQQSIQVPDLNCSLLLADLVTRTITGTKYKPAAEECLMHPREVILQKIKDKVRQNETEVKQALRSLLSTKEDEMPSSWFNKLSSYAKSMFHFLKLAKNDETEDYVCDVRNLFA